MKGGLDLQSPAIEMYPGKCFDALNYEPAISGGYRRINGYERSDGQTSPTTATYYVMTIAQTGTISNGDTVTGLTSSATGRALGIYGTTLVMGRVSGTFVAAESLQISAVTIATATTGATETGATSASDHADYMLLAANDRRADILVVPGSGQIRGVFVYADTVYAFRDNAGASAGDLYKQTGSGWSKVNFGTEIQFTGAVGEIVAGDTITGGTSGATATVVRPLLRTGTWTVSGVGTLIITVTAGTFQSGELLKVATVTKVTSSSLATAITRAAGGRVETVVANFTGSTATERVYGADGVNLAFEFDGTNYIPIRTGMTTDTPAHVIEHKGQLVLSYLGSIQFSSIGNPYMWSVVTGAAEITTGLACTGFVMQTGSSSGAALVIFTKQKTFTLYGASVADFSMVPSNSDIGYAAYTMQTVGNDVYGLTSRGIHKLFTTLNYGDFDYDAISYPIASLLAAKVGLESASTTLRTKDQYRLFFSDNSGVVVGLSGDKLTGLMLLDYGIPVRCITTAKLTTGLEVTYFGSDNGYIYLDNTGTSFDGAVIDALIRPAFNNLKSPRLRKRFRRATFEVKAEGYASVNVAYDLGYGNPSISPSIASTQSLTGAGSYWDSFTWDNFNWDAQLFSDPSISIAGTEKNISFFFYSSRAQDSPHTVQGVILDYTTRRIERT